jgi:transcriptional regulator with XRE-family HTH domain
MNQQTLPPYKALREAIGDLSQRAVERELGWSTGRLSTIERGLMPTEAERRQLLTFLNERLAEATQGEETA